MAPSGPLADRGLAGRGLAVLLLAAALILSFLASWIVLPPWHRRALPLAVGAPEVSHYLAVGCLLVAVVAALRGRRRRASRWACGIAAVAGAVAISPLARAPFVLRGFDRAMHEALGPDALAGASGGRPPLRSSALSIRELFLGRPDPDVRVQRGILIATAGGVPLRAVVYQPPVPGRYPSVVQIYGGAWQRGAPEDDAGAARYLASRGFVVFAVDYRHAPQWKWPAQMEDVRTCLQWIRDRGGDYGADVSRLALTGRSAGAHLAMVAAYDTPPLPIAAVVSYYGPADLEDGYRRPPVPDPLDVRAIEEAFLGGTPEQVPQQYRDASPVTHVSAASPPTLLIYGSRDHIVLPRYGAMLQERLRRAGAKAVFLEIPWAEHAFDAVPGGPSAQIATYYTERFLTRLLDGGRLTPALPPR